MKALPQSILPDLACLRTLVETATDIVVVVDLDGIICYVSPSVSTLLERDQEDVHGSHLLDWVHPEDVSTAGDAIRRVIAGEILDHVVVRVTRPTGEVRYCEGCGVPIRDGDVITGMAAIIRDVTEQHATEMALEETNNELMDTLKQLSHAQNGLVQKERQRAFAEVAGGIIHDFNNILSLISGHAELLMDQCKDTESEQIYKSMNAISKAALDGRHIVRRLRGVYLTGETADGVEPVDVNTVITELAQLTQIRRREDGEKQRGFIELHADLRPVQPIAADRVGISEAILNVLLNAFDAMPDGGTVSVSTRQLGEAVSIRIADTGAGMELDLQEHCFDAFLTTKGEQGTGLGLSETLAIVKRFHGAINVESEVGVGSKFTLTFPVLSLDDNAAPTAATLEGKKSSLLAIVVSEDDAIFDVINAYLRLDDHNVHRMSAEPLAKLHDSTADVVIRVDSSEGVAGPSIVVHPACSASAFGRASCPCEQLRIDMPLSLARFRFVLERSRSLRSGCENASQHIAAT